MTSSSDDSLPLLRRKVASDIFEKKKRIGILGDSSDSSLPSWLEEQNATRQGGAVTSRQANNNKRGMVFIDSDSDSEDNSIPVSKDKDAKTETKPKIEAGSDVIQDQPSTVVLDMSTVQQGSQATNKGREPSPSLKSIVNSNTATVIVPEKMPQSKLLLELESNDAIAGTTDLSGDSGVIGRMLLRKIAGPGGNGTTESMELDLKGRIYNMTPVQYPGTIMVLNFSGNEAKVESVTDMFIQLREDTRFSNDTYAEKLKQWLEDDDDDDNVLGKSGPMDASQGKNPGAPKRQARKKPGTSGVRKKPATSTKKTGAGRGRKK